MAAASVVSTTGADGYVRAISGGDYTMGRSDRLVKVDTTITSTVTLPDASLVGGLQCVVLRSAGILTVLTVNGQLGQTINGAASIIIPTVLYSAYTFQSDGANWYVV